VSAWIARRFGGDRAAADAAALGIAGRALGATSRERWSEDERRAFRDLALVVAQIPDLARWPLRDKRDAVALMRAKGGDEFRYFARLQKHHRLRAALAAIAGRATR